MWPPPWQLGTRSRSGSRCPVGPGRLRAPPGDEARSGCAARGARPLHDRAIRSGAGRSRAPVHRFPFGPTYRLPPPWISAMAQGEAASLLLRLVMETGEERFAEAARRALAPLRGPSTDGGACRARRRLLPGGVPDRSSLASSSMEASSPSGGATTSPGRSTTPGPGADSSAASRRSPPTSAAGTSATGPCTTSTRTRWATSRAPPTTAPHQPVARPCR